MSLLPSPASTPPHISEIATQHDIGLEATEWRWFQNQGLSDTSIDQMLRNVNRVTLRIEDDGDCLNRMRRCAERFNIPLGPDTITQAEEEYRKQFSMDAMWKEFTGRTEEEADIPEFLFEDWMGMQYLDAFNSFRRFVMKMEPSEFDPATEVSFKTVQEINKWCKEINRHATSGDTPERSPAGNSHKH
ncbi:MAG: hypothetical protein MMC23_010088 [Stictis urceolatum]|nr:hypothetical protein [Stictis urceolata]